MAVVSLFSPRGGRKNATLLLRIGNKKLETIPSELKVLNDVSFSIFHQAYPFNCAG